MDSYDEYVHGNKKPRPGQPGLVGMVALVPDPDEEKTGEPYALIAKILKWVNDYYYLVEFRKSPKGEVSDRILWSVRKMDEQNWSFFDSFGDAETHREIVKFKRTYEKNEAKKA